MAPAPQGHWGCYKTQSRTTDGDFHHLTTAIPPEGTTSREGTAASKPCGNEAGQKGQRWWSSRRQCPGSSESSPGWGAWFQGTSRRTDLQGRWTPVGLPQGMPPQAAMPPPTLTPSSPAGTPSQYSPSLQQHCSAPVTRHLCHLRPARDFAALGTGKGRWAQGNSGGCAVPAGGRGHEDKPGQDSCSSWSSCPALAVERAQPHPKGCSTKNVQRGLQALIAAGKGHQPLLQPGRFYTWHGRSFGSIQPLAQAFPDCGSLQPQHRQAPQAWPVSAGPAGPRAHQH